MPAAPVPSASAAPRLRAGGDVRTLAPRHARRSPASRRRGARPDLARHLARARTSSTRALPRGRAAPRRGARRAEPPDRHARRLQRARRREHDARPGLALRRHGPPPRARRLPGRRCSARTLVGPHAALETRCSRRCSRSPTASITYRRRYLGSLQLDAVLDLLLLDETNPRSLAFQLAALDAHVRRLPRDESLPTRSAEEQLALAVLTRVRLADVDDLCALGTRTRARARLDAAAARLRRRSAGALRRRHAQLPQPRRCRVAGSSEAPRELPRLARHHVPRTRSRSRCVTTSCA